MSNRRWCCGCFAARAWNALIREIGQPASVLSGGWRNDFLEAGMASLKRRTDDPKVATLEKQVKCVEMRIARFESAPPFPRRRPMS